MAELDPLLEIPRCPHCNVDQPNLTMAWRGETATHAGGNKRCWIVYACGRCGGLVTASAPRFGQEVQEIHPSPKLVDDELPERPRAFLEQAMSSLHAPAGAVLLAASSVDAMLKEKNYVKGSLHDRIEKAASDHLITEEMAKWAHEVRLDANDQRHADETAPMPTEADARRSVEFASALGTFLFALPARIQRGLADVQSDN